MCLIYPENPKLHFWLKIGHCYDITACFPNCTLLHSAVTNHIYLTSKLLLSSAMDHEVNAAFSQPRAPGLLTAVFAVSAQSGQHGTCSEAHVCSRHSPQRVPPPWPGPALVQAPGPSTKKLTVRSRTVISIIYFWKRILMLMWATRVFPLLELVLLWTFMGVSYWWFTDFSNDASYHVRNEAAWVQSDRFHVAFFKQLTFSVKRKSHNLYCD